MVASCPTVVEGDRIRITRVDSCGRPIYGDCAAVVTDGIVSIKFTPEVEEGEEKTQVNFAGRNCLSRAGCDTVKWWSVEMVWCNINFDAFSFMNPTYRLRRNEEGDPIGFYVSNKVDCSAGYAVEVWAQIDGASDACTGEEAQGQWIYVPIPWIAGATPSEITIGGEDSVTFTSTGKTRSGNRWGRGPYNVEIVDGIPAPLGEAIDPEEPMGWILTSLAPPEMDCGCQPVPRPVPDPAALTIEGIATEDPRMTVRVKADNSGMGPVTIDWGDGSALQDADDNRYASHTYETSGEKTITVCDKQDPGVCVTKTLTVPLPSDTPTVTVTGASTTEAPYRVSVQVAVPEQADGKAVINFGDGTGDLTVTAGPDGTFTPVIHDYKYPNRYTVTVLRHDKPTYYARQVITVPITQPAPVAPTGLTVDDAETTADTLTVDWQWTRGAGGAVDAFEVSYRTPAGSGTWSPPLVVQESARTATLTGLTAATEYEVQVVAVGLGGTSPAATVTGLTDAA
ncbi:fibronectin type III domain-containing protein [Streptomyces albogriseolus]|uniref:fibronectin type III domain-containing protein n=1 Tax=Streptomyces albogriseolus TaxID=1887 RepID=UPI0034608194